MATPDPSRDETPSSTAIAVAETVPTKEALESALAAPDTADTAAPPSADTAAPPSAAVPAVAPLSDDSRPATLAAAEPTVSASAPSLTITVLIQTGARHQFLLNSSFLARHAIKSSTTKEVLTDPLEMSVWQLKECIWKDWREGSLAPPSRAMCGVLIRALQTGTSGRRARCL